MNKARTWVKTFVPGPRTIIHNVRDLTTVGVVSVVNEKIVEPFSSHEVWFMIHCGMFDHFVYDGEDRYAYVWWDMHVSSMMINHECDRRLTNSDLIFIREVIDRWFAGEFS